MRHIPALVLAGALMVLPSAIRAQSGTDAAASGAPPVRASTDATPPPNYTYGDQRPGRSQRLARAWPGAPALIPHAIKGLTPITATRNACAGCHGRTVATSGPPPAPPSHFIDLRDAPGETRSRIASSRWNCTACHVPQTNAPPLVR